jgi:serine/threonine protein phosphatase PrpC
MIMSYAVNTHAGISSAAKLANLDRVAIIQSSSNPEKDNPNCKFSFFAVYEGLGNPNAEAANYLRDNLHRIIFRDPNFRRNPTLALVHSIKKASRCISLLNNKYNTSEAAGKPGLEKKETSKDKGSTASTLLVVMLLEDQDESTPTICLCASVGASRAVLSAGGGLKLFSLNNEHCVPGNPNEEERIIEQLTKRSGMRNISSGSLELKQAQNDLTEFVCQMKMPQTRMIGILETPKVSSNLKF